jgi:four helix bundle protein
MISGGSLYETMTLLEIFLLRKWITKEDFDALQIQADQIAKMLNVLNNSLSKQE